MQFVAHNIAKVELDSTSATVRATLQEKSHRVSSTVCPPPCVLHRVSSTVCQAFSLSLTCSCDRMGEARGVLWEASSRPEERHIIAGNSVFELNLNIGSRIFIPAH